MAWRQLVALGYSRRAIQHRVDAGRLVTVFDGVYAVAPLGDDARTRWMAATLTTPDSVLSHASAGAAHGFRPFNAQFEVITRPGSGGPRRLGDLLVCRTNRIEASTHQGIPITTPERTLIDLAPHLNDKDLARAVRDAIRLKHTTPSDLFIALARRRGRRAPAACTPRSPATPASRSTGRAAMPRRWRSTYYEPTRRRSTGAGPARKPTSAGPPAASSSSSTARSSTSTRPRTCASSGSGSGPAGRSAGSPPTTSTSTPSA